MREEFRKFDRSMRRLKDTMAELTNPGFAYYEQELIRRVFKSILPQLRDKTDIGTAKDILEKTEWLEKI